VTCSPGAAGDLAAGRDGIEIAGRSPACPEVACLLRAFHQEQVSRYGSADPAELQAGQYTAPHGLFAIAYHGAHPVGCGGYRWFDRAAGTVELRKLYIIPAWRGRGAGRGLLAWLERQAVAAGATRAILETGVRNSAALRLITAAGYQPIDRYVQGRDPAINLAFARPLT
jgi:GNAT superfamily N-acetyltransferase